MTQVIVAAAVGLVVGSFLALAVIRLPARKPIVLGRSACPRCGHVLGPTELVPVLSFLAQGRRCRACGGRISAFYPAMEIAAAAIAAAAAYWTSGVWLGVACLAGWTALACAAAILRKRWRSPDSSTD
jgi:leader peptidase (prepilin peptidase) / N-methyltransferase